VQVIRQQYPGIDGKRPLGPHLLQRLAQGRA
jgi:hypothetical protein